MGSDRTARRLCALLVALLVLAAAAGCARSANESTSFTMSGRSSAGGGVAPGAPAADQATTNGAQTKSAASASPASAPVADRMVIRNANVRLEVPKVQAAVGKLRALAASHGAVVSNLQLSSDTGGGYPEPATGTSDRILRSGLPYTASVTVLVPVGRFDAFRASAEKLGKVLSEASADDDVTQQHADLKARLLNAKAEEARLRTFFEKARNVGEMLAIERELARVRADIESMTAQLDTMERQAAMATLTLELVEPQPIVRPSNGIDWGFAEALTTGIQGLADFLRAIIVIVISSAPLWLAAVAVALLVRWRVRARKARHAEGEAETGPERTA